MFNILIADDEENILNLYKIRLEKRGYNIFTAVNGKQALDIFFANSIDLIILDIMMPVLNGLEAIKKIRDEGYNTPAIIVSARGEISTKVQGFNNGIDDYLTKPFEFDELLMRIQALLRRSKIAFENKMVINNTVLNYEDLTIKDDNNYLKLTKKEFQIVYKLLSYPERTFTKNEIFNEFWNLSSDVDSDIVKVYISKIRNQIKIFNDFSIDTVRGIGYRGIKNEKVQS